MSSQNLTSPSERILLIDDTVAHQELKAHLTQEGYTIKVCTDVAAAVVFLQSPVTFCAVIIVYEKFLSEFLKAIKNYTFINLSSLILVTPEFTQHTQREALLQGINYCYTQTAGLSTLQALVHCVRYHYLKHQQFHTDFKRLLQGSSLLQQGRFTFQTLQEAHNLSFLLAQACPDRYKALTGLSEILINAIEHGNLSIDYTQKSLLLAENRWQEEIERLLSLPENRDKYVTVDFCKEPKNQKITIVVTDMGKGFEWQQYLDLDPTRLLDHHGRGILIANHSSFDNLEYLGKGNISRISISY